MHNVSSILYKDNQHIVSLKTVGHDQAKVYIEMVMRLDPLCCR